MTNPDNYIEGDFDPNNPANQDNENTCNYCGENCAKEFCDNNCKKAYEND